MLRQTKPQADIDKIESHLTELSYVGVIIADAEFRKIQENGLREHLHDEQFSSFHRTH